MVFPHGEGFTLGEIPRDSHISASSRPVVPAGGVLDSLICAPRGVITTRADRTEALPHIRGTVLVSTEIVS